MLDQIAQLTYWFELSMIDSKQKSSESCPFCKSSYGLTQRDNPATGGQSPDQTVTFSLR
uniref:Uncharacterized protein n=1 Tax=Arundo donax TaxID=35708 RepID=A0A0A9DBW8_ARUDO